MKGSGEREKIVCQSCGELVHIFYLLLSLFLLGVFIKLRKVTFSFVMSVHQSVITEQLGS